MSVIKVLPEEVANRIAAGEVVERPVSVVRELVENALDAGASEITIELEAGGRKLIKVTDNGHGMSPDDAFLAFERHATSKIENVEDIFTISTMGFRGEALPSIASVASLILVTRRKEDQTATQIEFSGGVLKNSTQVAANPGTSVSVERLFINVPARRKFLRSAQVEYKHILNYLHYMSIVHRQISFKLVGDGKTRLNYPPADDTRSRLLAVFGSSFERADVITVDYATPHMQVKGWVSGLEEPDPTLAQVRYLFINGRYIKDKIIFHALRQAVEPFVKLTPEFRRGQLPPFIIFLQMDPGQIDFNVHPAKLEVRFADSQTVHHAVKTAVYNAFYQYEEQKFAQVKQKLFEEQAPARITPYETRLYQQRSGVTEPTRQDGIAEAQQLYQPDFFQPELPPLPPGPEPPRRKIGYLPTEEELINPWQLHNSYIMIEVEDGVMVIDQHAAHERIIYERIVKHFEGEDAPRQKLLFPLVVDVPPYLAALLDDLLSEHGADFAKAGFVVKLFSGNSLVVEEVPTGLGNWEGGEIVGQIMQQLQLEYEQCEDLRDSLAKSVACKAAIKAGYKMQPSEMVTLITNLFACHTPYFCPHGRPLVFKITLDELEKRFKRVL